MHYELKKMPQKKIESGNAIRFSFSEVSESGTNDNKLTKRLRT